MSDHTGIRSIRVSRSPIRCHRTEHPIRLLGTPRIDHQRQNSAPRCCSVALHATWHQTLMCTMCQMPPAPAPIPGSIISKRCSPNERTQNWLRVVINNPSAEVASVDLLTPGGTDFGTLHFETPREHHSGHRSARGLLTLSMHRGVPCTHRDRAHVRRRQFGHHTAKLDGAWR